ncbi:glycosyltransferase family 1 protein [Rhodotorula graminis WP1]|uniref:Sterol 3-beta-glucosyltransferase n=1 Tax=Rhodotorula graminis (strain WP1) TaxID=578459 RepID=A0A194S819_RHOGW|nr:glycosyltransferase family 1 protein [Rhodotorula graminis WP1]KPV76709.1 glycosyltransferase family 1 protein [Rhodotorula graminis WP1]
MDVFGLDEPEEVVAEYPCWLFRAILLQGFLYVTAGHLCFYAYLAQKEGTTVRSGSLSVRSSRTRRYGKHWFVLKDSVFSWFPSSTDPYFPDGHIDLHYAISVEPSQFHKHHFKVATADKKWHFSADSEASRDEWVKTLKKGVFRCQNEGESVKIAIPLETIVDVEKSSSLEFAETIRVRVYDADEFRRTFGLSEKEILLDRFPAYLFRGLPIFGHVYISSAHFCFRSAGLLTAKTKMILPLSDIIGASKHRSYRIGYSGLMVIIKGHEEVFFELNNSDRRDACLANLDEQRELVKKQKRDQSGDDKKDDESEEHQQLRDLLDLSEARSAGQSPLDLPHPRSEAVQGQPPIMFSSTTSDFITFKPDEPLRVTCLTIGSRGDVQPYIALCKGLMAQGHKCKIASHGEYRKWVEGHGIEFSAVGGDPAELMQLMISHDFFTISFMKEAVGRFRGWLDDLLASAWKACQDTDLLIESPSAIAGFHVAEALRIPYYRAFTMPWSRTRAYPHAFAVPEVHMGGGYNYMTYTMFDQVFWRATSGQVNRWRRDTLKLKPTSLEAMQQHKIPFLYNFSPVVIPPPLDWRENIHVTGYWWLDNPDDSDQSKWEPPEELTKWLDEAKDNDKKVVFIGFGSIIIPDPLEMTRVVVEAAEKAGVYAIVAKGWSDRQKGDDDDGEPDEEKEEKREQNEKRHQELMDKPFIFSVKSIPHDWLFPRISAAVHHGGAGTTGASLRAGLPTIIKPFFGDQHFYADRVSTLGIGSHIRNFTVENLTEALKTAVSDDKQIERARLAGEEIRKEDGVATAIECIYRDLEYARSLVPPRSTALVEGEIAEVEVDDDSSDDDSDSGSSSSSSDEKDEKDEKVDDEKARLKERDATEANPGRPAISAPPTEKVQGVQDPSRSAQDPASPSQRDESRATSSDEGWDVMSRGSAADTTVSASWEDGGDASRASSKARSTRSGPEGGVEGAGGEEDDGGAGLTARMLGFLGKPVKAVKKDA